MEENHSLKDARRADDLQKFPAFYENLSFITKFTTARPMDSVMIHYNLFNTATQLLSFFSISSPCFRLRLTIDLFLSGSPTKILNQLFMRITHFV
jgi:hypothetical protein